MAIDFLKRKSDETGFPAWLAKTISDNTNKKFLLFLKEPNISPKWTSWAKCSARSKQNFHTYLSRRKPLSSLHLNPNWKYRCIETKFSLQRYFQKTKEPGKEEYVISILNRIAKYQEDYDPISKTFLRLVHFETTKLNLFKTGFRNANRNIKAIRWPIAAHRNYLRMMRTEFPDLVRSYSRWDLCFRHCKKAIYGIGESEWYKAFQKCEFAIKRRIESNDLL
ncbi:hypothetical protein LEP1GSC061_0083 [Leptospira wolffii serovar Khorat str. Khorat-H2]|nr:hypothetical protein LEP1GSC061_0083 [Leptospira wolffii serovar Khorat str. Khorat-H2]